MRVLDLALKDLSQIVRDRKSAIFLVVMPIVFTLFFGFAFGSTDETPRLPVGWVNHDEGGSLATSLQELIVATEAIRLDVLEGEAAERVDARVRDEALAAAVIVPEGFSAQAMTDDPLPLTIIAVPGSLAGQTATTALQAALNRLLGAVQAAHLSAEVLDAQRPFTDDAARQAVVVEDLAQASAAWQQPAVAVALEPAAGAQAEQSKTPSGFVQSSPGMLVQFAVFGLITSAMVLVLERKSKTLQRLLTTPVGPATVIAGHLLAMFVVVFLQEVLLIALGQFLFGVDYLRQPVGTLLMMVALGLWAASLGLFISAIAKAEEQVVMYALIAMFVFSALGGAWFPLEMAGSTFSRVGHVLPTAWAMEGFQNLVLRGLGLSAVLLPAGLLLAYAAAFFGLAVWRFRFE